MYIYAQTHTGIAICLIYTTYVRCGLVTPLASGITANNDWDNVRYQTTTWNNDDLLLIGRLWRKSS